MNWLHMKSPILIYINLQSAIFYEENLDDFRFTGRWGERLDETEDLKKMALFISEFP